MFCIINLIDKALMMWQYSGAICIFCRSWSLQKRRPSISTVVWTLDDLPPHSGIQPRRNNLFLIQVSLLKWFWNAFIVNRHILYIALHCCYKKHISEVWCLHTFYPMKIAYWREGKWCVCVCARVHTHTHTHTHTYSLPSVCISCVPEGLAQVEFCAGWNLL